MSVLQGGLDLLRIAFMLAASRTRVEGLVGRLDGL